MAKDLTILLVDEVEWFRELGGLFLARSGRVLEASNAKEALTIARRERPDIVISDLDMPERDGADLCFAIRRDPTLAYTPVIILIGSERPQDHARAIRAGATDILTKPLSRSALIESVCRLTRFETPQGRPRIRVAAPVRVEFAGTESWGTLRNLSRGGAFVEMPEPVPGGQEIELDFQIPGSPRTIRPTAQVVWSQRDEDGHEGSGVGHGMRFLAVDRSSVEALDEFVSEHAPYSAAPAA